MELSNIPCLHNNNPVTKTRSDEVVRKCCSLAASVGVVWVPVSLFYNMYYDGQSSVYTITILSQERVMRLYASVGVLAASVGVVWVLSLFYNMYYDGQSSVYTITILSPRQGVMRLYASVGVVWLQVLG
ncbi:hypothetical protein J6590_066037 [Homalodisca vitripennis]|nr:hypothetical protein J6590_066037 [Homalodisca vitripennis]